MKGSRVQVSDSALENERIVTKTILLFFNMYMLVVNEGPPKSSFAKGGFRRNVNISPNGMQRIPSSSLGFSSWNEKR